MAPTGPASDDPRLATLLRLSLSASGMTPEAVRSTLDNLLQGQSVMLATNQIMAIVAGAFLLAACVIWLAPRPSRAVDMTQVGH